MEEGLTERHRQAIVDRGLDLRIIRFLGMHSRQDGSLAMPYYRRGQLHNTKLRRGKGNMPWEIKDRQPILYNADCLIDDPAPGESLIIVEGELDCAACLQVGYKRVVSTPSGAPSSASETGDKRFAYLYHGRGELLPDIAKFDSVILAVDGDENGQWLRDALAMRIGDTKCTWVDWPEGCKDANDVLRRYGPRHGPDQLRSAINSSRRMWLDMVAGINDIPDQPPEAVYKLGWPILDRDLSDGGIRIPQVGFMSVGGPAGSGKSTWVRQICWHLWKAHKIPFGITALEEDVKPDYYEEFLRLETGKAPDEWSQEEHAYAHGEIAAGVKFIQAPSHTMMDVDLLLGAVEYAIKVYGLSDYRH